MNEYPTQEQLDAIALWPADQLLSWFDYIQEAGKYWPEDDYWTQEGSTYHISTAGWSGNEEILEAMGQNFACWALTWQSHRCGGHYVFEIPSGARPSGEGNRDTYNRRGRIASRDAPVLSAEIHGAIRAAQRRDNSGPAGGDLQPHDGPAPVVLSASATGPLGGER